MKYFIATLLIGAASVTQAQSLDVDAYNRLVRKHLQTLEDQELDALLARLKASNDIFNTPAVRQPTEYDLCAREALRAGWQPQAYGCVYVPARIW
jgi:hypothetical protein